MAGGLGIPVRLRRPVATVVVMALVVAACVYAAVTVLGSGGGKNLTAYFPRTIGIYKGSAVKILGVQVGTVTRVHPEGTRVRVDIRYGSDHILPADVGAVLVPPSVVADRYVQLTPVYTGGAALPDGGTIQEDRTQIPVELDQIFSSINDLDTALGPTGANKSGALSTLIAVAAANLQGNGSQVHTTLKGVSAAISALSDSKDALFGTITRLQQFTATLAGNDGGIRQVSHDLTAVSSQLAGERQDLGAALSNLATALGQVQEFVADNRDQLAHDVGALTSVTNGLMGEKQAITELLDEAPLAVYNLLEATSLTDGDCGADLYDNGYQGCYGVLRSRVRLDPTTLLSCILGNAAVCATAQSDGNAATKPPSGGPGPQGTPNSATPSPDASPSGPLDGAGSGSLGDLLGSLLGGGSSTTSPAPAPSQQPTPSPPTGGLLGGLGKLLGSDYRQPSSLASIWALGAA